MKLAVIFGGMSTEHDVSIVSGTSIIKNLKQDKYDIYPIYIDEEGKCQNHFHFKCKVCGELYHLDCSFLNTVKNHLCDNHGFEIDSSKTVFYGTCKKCLKKLGGKND